MKLKNCEIGKKVRLKAFKEAGFYEVVDIDKKGPKTKVRIKNMESNNCGFWADHKDLKVVKND